MDHTLLPTLAQFDKPKVAENGPPPGNATGNGADPITKTPGGQQELGDVPPQQQQRQGGDGSFMLMIALMLGLFFFVMMGGQRKEKKKRTKLLASVKKGDKVNTVGGIIGTIVELRENEVLLKVDENANTRIKFTRSSIQSLVSERSE
jgi:preprotein translocase subunit YajC